MRSNSILATILLRQDNDSKRSKIQMQREIDQLRWDNLKLKTEIEMLVLHPESKTAEKIRIKHTERLHRKQVLNDAVKRLSEETRSLLPVPASLYKSTAIS